MENKKAKTRTVLNKTIFSNLNTDSTSHLKVFLSNEIENATREGIPSRIHFYITKNANMNLTKENGLLDLTIPIIPVCYDTKSTRSLSEFITTAKNPEIIQQKTENSNSKLLYKRVASYADKILVYIKNEIAIRYAVAKENNDQKTMQQLSKLQIMKDFDLELYYLLLKQPTSINRTTSFDLKYHSHQYSFNYDNGENINISNSQFESIKYYERLMERYKKAKDKFFSLSKVLGDFEVYDSTKQAHESTIPAHSIIARGVSARTNNRVTKPAALDNTKNSKTETKQSQPGDE